MKRIMFVSIGVVAVLGAFFSLAAMPPKAESDLPDLSGNVVIVDKSGHRFGPRENVRFETVGGEAFVVLPLATGREHEHDFWIALDKLDSLRVFETMQEAETYDAIQFPKAAAQDN